MLLHFTHVHWDQIKESLCRCLESRPMLGKDHLPLVPLLFGTACYYQSAHPLQFPPSGNVSRHIFLTWSFPHRHRHARWPVDVVELLHKFCCWSLIWMSRHWAWLRRGYWCYRNLVDWLIDCLITYTTTVTTTLTILWRTELLLPFEKVKCRDIHRFTRSSVISTLLTTIKKNGNGKRLVRVVLLRTQIVHKLWEQAVPFQYFNRYSCQIWGSLRL